MERCLRLGMRDTALMNAGTLVAAWKSGGYCRVRTSPNSGEPYLGRWMTEATEV
jgi:hypothetical protein